MANAMQDRLVRRMNEGLERPGDVPWTNARRQNYSTPAQTAAALENYKASARRAMELENVAKRTEKASDWQAAAKEQRNAATLAEKAGLRSTADAHAGDEKECEENARRLGGNTRTSNALQDGLLRRMNGTGFTEGQAVRIVGEVEGKGQKGVISQVAPSGRFYGVSKNGNHLGYYHESDLKAV